MLKRLKISSGFFCLFILICGSIVGGFFVWNGIYSSKLLISQKQESFSIESGEGVLVISSKLEKSGFIENKRFFQIYALLTGSYKKFKPGTYLLNNAMNIPEIVSKFTDQDILQASVTIPEGFTIKQIEERVNHNIAEITEFEAKKIDIQNEKVGDYKEDYAFLNDSPDLLSLEGFIFPDTYLLEPNISKEEIVRIFLDNTNRKLTDEIKTNISDQGKTIFEIITMASLLEKEVRTLTDKKAVSAILWKRLENDMPLQVDATIVFITGQKTSNVSIQQTQIDSPYNTYLNKGLPKGPICNPGIDSIIAATYPQENNFWFYLSAQEGQTIYSETFEKHILAKERYLK